MVYIENYYLLSMHYERILGKKICCSSCNNEVIFELIEDIECDMGSHDVIQCPKCQDLFSLDKQCSAFQDLLNLIPYNADLIPESEQREYLTNPHRF